MHPGIERWDWMTLLLKDEINCSMDCQPTLSQLKLLRWDFLEVTSLIMMSIMMKLWSDKPRTILTDLIFHCATRFWVVPVAKPSFFVLFSSSCNSCSSPAKNKSNVHSYLRPTSHVWIQQTWSTWSPTLCSYLWTRDCAPHQQLKTSGIWFSTPDMWATFISNSHLAATNFNSLKRPNKNGLCALPVFSTVTDVSLSHQITIIKPHHILPQTFTVTSTVSNSSAKMLSFCFLIHSRNSAGKCSLSLWLCKNYATNKESWVWMDKQITPSNQRIWYCECPHPATPHPPNPPRHPPHTLDIDDNGVNNSCSLSDVAECSRILDKNKNTPPLRIFTW